MEEIGKEWAQGYLFKPDCTEDRFEDSEGTRKVEPYIQIDGVWYDNPAYEKANWVAYYLFAGEPIQKL